MTEPFQPTASPDYLAPAYPAAAPPAAPYPAPAPVPVAELAEEEDLPEFTTRTDDDGDGDDAGEVYRFKLDGVTLTARRPKQALIAQIAPASSRRTPALTKIKLALDFLGDCLDDESRAYLETRLLDPADRFDVDDAMPILTAIGDHFRGRNATRRERRAAARR